MLRTRSGRDYCPLTTIVTANKILASNAQASLLKIKSPAPAHNAAFGRVLAELREARGFSQELLGFEADLDRSAISLLERGLRSPTLGTLLSLSHALDISLSDLAALIEARLALEVGNG